METLREKLYRAAISCGHEITKDQIILYADTRKEGNALSQLADRLEQSIKQLEQELAEAKKDQARYCYAVKNMLILSEEDGMFLVEKETADKLIDAAIKESSK